MSDFSHLIHHYGYLAIFLGTILEGETVSILAGIASHKGLLKLPITLLVAFCGATFGDIIMFTIGHFCGDRFVRRIFKNGNSRVESIRDQIHKHQALAIIGVRFLYGLRIAGPIVIGASHVTFPKFVLFNVIGAIVWSILFVGGGYLFGSFFTHAMNTMDNYAIWIIPIVIILVVGIRWWLGRRRQDDKSRQS